MKKLLAVAVFALAAGLPAWQAVHAQSPARSSAGADGAAKRHFQGLALQRRGDQKGAFLAFQDAAERGYPPAQRRLGEIYDTGNKVVPRDYEESIRWYEKARAGGEQIPPPTPRGNPLK